MKPAIIALILLLCCSLISSSAGGYAVMNSSPSPEPEKKKVPSPEPEKKKVPGCTDPNANNTSPGADEDDGSCLYDRKAAFKFTGNDGGKMGCYYKNEKSELIQEECSPELEQAEFDVITNSDSDITEVKTCFVEDDVMTYNQATGKWDKVSSTRKSIKIGDENEPGTECKMFRAGPIMGGDTIGDKRIIGYSRNLNSGSPIVTLVDNDEPISDAYAPVKLHLIPQ